MTSFFPTSQTIEVNPKVDLLAYQCGDSILQLASLLPGSTFALHQHVESQMGLIVSGLLEMNVDGTKEVMKPLQQVYFADSNVPHGAINPFLETAWVIDVKYIHNASTASKAHPAMFKMTPHADDQSTNLDISSVSTDWFEVMMTMIPPNQDISDQSIDNDLMGVVLDGVLTVSVGTEKRELQHGGVYYVPSHTESGVFNSSNKAVKLIKISV